MKQIIQRRNAIVRWTLVIILAADLVLIGVNWKLNRSPHVQAADLRRLEMLEKSFRADNARLEKFRSELPADEKQWDEFFNMHFHPVGAGYSAISEDGDNCRFPPGCTRTQLHFINSTPMHAA